MSFKENVCVGRPRKRHRAMTHSSDKLSWLLLTFMFSVISNSLKQFVGCNHQFKRTQKFSEKKTHVK